MIGEQGPFTALGFFPLDKSTFMTLHYQLSGESGYHALLQCNLV